MKNYFNTEATSMHLIAILTLPMLKKLKEMNCTTDYEKDCLTDAIEALDDFNNSVFERLGEGYKKSLQNKMNDNDIRVIGKKIVTRNNTQQQFTDIIDGDMLENIVTECSWIKCTDCKDKCEYLNCPLYNIQTFLSKDGCNLEEGECPFYTSLASDNELDDDKNFENLF